MTGKACDLLGYLGALAAIVVGAVAGPGRRPVRDA